MNRFFAAMAVGCLVACSEAPNSANVNPQPGQNAPSATLSESDRLNQWFETMFEEQLQMNPTRLTQLGRKDKYDQFEPQTEAEQQRQLAWMASTVEALRNEFDYDQLNIEAQTSYDLWVSEYELNREAAQYTRQNYVFTQMQGAHTAVAQFLIHFHKVDEAADAQAYIKRIGAASQAIRDLLDRAKVNASEGVRPPRYAYDAVIAESQNLITGAPFSATPDGAAAPPQSPLWADINGKIDALLAADKVTEAQATTLRADAQAALNSAFLPAYQALIDWLKLDIDNTDEAAQGVGSRAGGNAFYAFELKRRTTTNLSAEAIHQLGLEEVARLREEMTALKDQLGFAGELPAFFRFLKEDEQFYFSDDDAGAEQYIAAATERLGFIEQKLPQYFGLLPKAKLVVKRVEAFREQDGGAQFYSRGTPDGSRPGCTTRTCRICAACPKRCSRRLPITKAIQAITCRFRSLRSWIPYLPFAPSC